MTPPPGVLVRRAVPADAGEVLVVQLAAFVAEAQRYGDPRLPPLVETVEDVAAAVAGQVVLVAVLHTARGERVVGAVRLRVDGATGHVGRLVVAPDVQRRGVGSALLAAVEAAAPRPVRELALFTGAASVDSVARYERAGYVRTGTGTDPRRVALVHLAKPLPPPAGP